MVRATEEHPFTMSIGAVRGICWHWRDHTVSAITTLHDAVRTGALVWQMVKEQERTT